MDVHLRQSKLSMNSNDDLEQDRRLLNQKLQLRKSRQQQSYVEEDLEDDPSVLDYYNYNKNSDWDNNNNISNGGGENYYNDVNIGEGNDGIDVEDYLRQAHEHDEQLIGGRVPEEGFEAMNQALTSPPVAWWAKRKQWQKRNNGLGSSGRSGLGTSMMNMGQEFEMMVGNNDQEEGIMMNNHIGEQYLTDDQGVIGHPVMNTDPTAMGFDTDAFRNAYYSSSSFSNNKKKRGSPAVLFVTRAELKRRRAQQMAYIIAAMCAIFLFIFFLEQLKLSHYAMVESPISLADYLSGERYDETVGNPNNKVTLGSLGLEEFDGDIQGIPIVEFGKVPIDPNDPLAQQIQTETAGDGSGGETEFEQQSTGITHGSDYFETLKGVITGSGVTPDEVFANKHSPQYKALRWMAYEDILRRQPDTDFNIKKIIQRYVLSTVYFATAGNLWRHSALFLSNLDECSWNTKVEPKYFLGAGACVDGFVTRLELWGNHLTVSVLFRLRF